MANQSHFVGFWIVLPHSSPTSVQGYIRVWVCVKTVVWALTQQQQKRAQITFWYLNDVTMVTADFTCDFSTHKIMCRFSIWLQIMYGFVIDSKSFDRSANDITNYFMDHISNNKTKTIKRKSHFDFCKILLWSVLISYVVFQPGNHIVIIVMMINHNVIYSWF